MPFPIDGALELSVYLQPFSRYWAVSTLESQSRPFRVTWHHQSRDHQNCYDPFPINLHR